MNGNTLYEMSQYMQNFTPEDLAYLPKHIIIALKVIGKLAPLFYQSDTRTEEEFDAIIAPQMRDQLMDISGGKGKPRLYLPASARISQFRDIYRNGFIFSCIIEHNPEKKIIKKVLRAKKNPSEPNVYDEEVYYGEAEALAIIFTGREQVGMGHKIEDAAGFEDYRIKAITGAKARAAADLGLSTTDVFKADDAAIADAPIDPKFALLLGAQQHPTSNGTVASRLREDAPLVGSAQVSTRATIEPLKPAKPNTTAISAQLVALRKNLSQPEIFQVNQYLCYLGLPLYQNEWNAVQYTLALQGMKDWLTPVNEALPTKEQIDLINGYAASMDKVQLQQTSGRLCGVKGSKELNRTRMGYLLGVLKQGQFIYELTNQVDPDYTLLKQFGYTSSYDLLYADLTEGQVTWSEYVTALKGVVPGKPLTDPFRKKYEQELADFLKG